MMNKEERIKDILLIYLSQDSSFIIKDALEYRIKRVPKLGFLYLAAVLERKGVRTRILDQSLRPFTFKNLVEILKKRKFGIIGFYSATALKLKLIYYIKMLRQSGINIPMIVGGPGYFSAQEYLEAGCDIVCKGESEITICEIIDYYNKESDIRDIKGVYYLSDGKAIFTQEQNIIQNLDALPFPKREVTFSKKNFYNFCIFNMRMPYTTMITSRGCPYNCTYCSSPYIWGNKIRLRSTENVIAEINQCIDKFGIKYIGFKDDIFGMDIEWLEKFCEMMKMLKYRILWSAMVHPFSFKQNKVKMIKLLRDSGCDMLIFGLQSAHPKILTNIKRSPLEPDELAETIELAKSNNISTTIEFILGLPEENKETITTTINYALKVKPHYARFNILSILEGSEIEREFKNNQVCKFSTQEIEDWCAYASRRFYLNVTLLMRNFMHIFFKNPSWFLKIAPRSFYLLKYFGLKTDLPPKKWTQRRVGGSINTGSYTACLPAGSEVSNGRGRLKKEAV